MGALPAVGGSVISVLLYTFFVWAIFSLAMGRFSFRLTGSDRLLAWTFTIFAGMIVLTAFAGENRSTAPLSFTWLLAFLSPWAIIPRLRASPAIDYLEPYTAGAATAPLPPASSLSSSCRFSVSVPRRLPETQRSSA